MSGIIKEVNSNEWTDHMLNGEFEEAWKFSDRVLKSRAGKPCWHLPRHLQYIWNGESLQGKKVLVRCYHGLGDTIQFIRFAPLIKSIAKEVIVWAQEPLLPLLQTAEGIDRLIPLHDGTPDVDYDVDVEIMELPYIFRIAVQSIPLKIPYLHLYPKRLQPFNGKLNVGIAWQPGNWNEQRSIPFPLLAPLGTMKDINLYILQSNPASYGWTEGFGIHPHELNLYDYAQIIKGLDLIISVDSMPVHLAGALGRPVWTLLQSRPDWRWMNNRSDSPWYPTMRIFRQEREGDWKAVIEEVTSALEAACLLSTHSERNLQKYD